MPALPKFFKRKKPQKDFLILEIGLERVVCAIFKKDESHLKLVGVGRKKFSTDDEIFNASLEAFDGLAAIVPEFPETGYIGVTGGSLETVTTLASYTREKPKNPIEAKETANALEQVVENLGSESRKIFFSTVASASLDGVRVSNPLGLKGEQVELACFAALKLNSEIELLDRIAGELDLDVQQILPSSFAVARYLQKKDMKDVLALRVGSAKSEITILSEGHISEIFPVDIGVQSQDFFPSAFQAALKAQPKETFPSVIWLFSDNEEVDLGKLKEFLSGVDWVGQVGFPVLPKIEVAESVHNYSQADIGLYSLSLEVDKT